MRVPACLPHGYTRHVLAPCRPAQEANTYFNTLRIVEDSYYQANFRQVLASYVSQVLRWL